MALQTARAAKSPSNETITAHTDHVPEEIACEILKPGTYAVIAKFFS
jgi:hypothetical protein